MTTMNPVVHFEMPAKNRQRMIDFYAQTFGWKTEQMGPEMQDYVVVSTCERGEDGFPKEKGRINGGFYGQNEDPQANRTTVVIAVEDIREHVKKVEAGGGKVLGEPMEIPGIGWYATFLDTEGNRVSMIQPTAM